MRATTFVTLVLVSLPIVSMGLGADLWVDRQNGSDANIGSRTEPFRSVSHALRQIEPGVTLHLQPGSKPYAAGIRIEVSGTAEAPIVIDGHGSVVSGRCRLPSERWQAEGGDIFSRSLPNNAWGMEHHWEGGFPLVWFDGREGRNVVSRDALEPLCYFMDQGMSHHGAQVVVRNAHFHHNAGGGVVDVYPEARVRYERCLIESDTWRGGVEFHSGRFAMVDCVIRDNQKVALTVTKGAQVKLQSCLFASPKMDATTGINIGGQNSRLEMSRCTLRGFAVGLSARIAAENYVAVDNTAWLPCSVNSRIRSVQAIGEATVRLSDCLRFSRNHYEPAPWELVIQRQTPNGGWKTDQSRFAADQHALFAAQIGTDADAEVEPVDECLDVLSNER